MAHSNHGHSYQGHSDWWYVGRAIIGFTLIVAAIGSAILFFHH